MKSPCVGCVFEAEDKNRKTCTDCSKRLQYIAKIENNPEAFFRQKPLAHNVQKQKENKIMTEEKTRICCRCKEEKPLTSEFFHKKLKDKEGFNTICSSCRSIYRKEHEASKKNNLKIIDNINPATNERNILNLDFSEHPELFNKIREIAKEEFRPMENQVLYWINKNLQIKEAAPLN